MKTLEKKSYGVRLKKPEDIRRFLARVINEVNAGKMEVERGRAIGYLCNILLTCTEKQDQEKRLEILEEKMK